MKRTLKGPPCESMLLARSQKQRRDSDDDNDSDWVPQPAKKAAVSKHCEFNKLPLPRTSYLTSN